MAKKNNVVTALIEDDLFDWLKIEKKRRNDRRDIRRDKVVSQSDIIRDALAFYMRVCIKNERTLK